MSNDDLSNWSFDVDEVSAGVYKAIGEDRQGRKVEATGTEAVEMGKVISIDEARIKGHLDTS